MTPSCSASLKKAAAIPAKSLLFNIDQKATLIAKDQTDALLKVFVKVFDESRGYYGNDGHVARFERRPRQPRPVRRVQGCLRQASLGSTGPGTRADALEGHNIDKAFAEVNGEANPGIIKQYQRLVCRLHRGLRHEP
jgi:hypothetical protein